MKTILHVIDTTGPGGAETVFINLADKIREQGYRCIALIRGKGWVYDELQRRRIETVVLDCKGSFNLSFLRQLIKLIKKEQVDIIQSHLLGSNIYCAMAGILARKPVFATFHGAVDVANKERFLKLKCFILNRGVRQFITVSETLKDEIQSSGLLDSKKTTVIYNGIDPSNYYRRDSSDLRQRLKLSKEKKLIGSLGNIRPAKAYSVLVKAAAIVTKVDPNLHFVIAGDTSRSNLMDELNQLATSLDVQSNVHFIGYQNNSASFLGKLDAFLLTSSSEGFSIATIEALATGLPVIATKCGGPEEILKGSAQEELAEVNDESSIARSVLKALNSPKAPFEFTFSLSNSVQKYLMIYTEK